MRNVAFDLKVHVPLHKSKQEILAVQAEEQERICHTYYLKHQSIRGCNLIVFFFSLSVV
jgi:hypothetical protein